MTRPAIHLGEILADELEELAVSPTELARQINLQTAHDIPVAAQQVGAEIKRLPTRQSARTPARKAS